MSGTLYITATPIGNLSDVSQRALDTLSGADFIAAEDSRVTLKLLSRFSISRPVVSYHEHNKETAGPRIAARIAAGENCALVTDAGMPAISDPGRELVCLVRGYGCPVTVIPGPCAAVCAVALSGLECGRFSFEGFLPAEAGPRAKRLRAAALYDGCLVFYEAPHRLFRTLGDLAAALGDMPAAVIKEISKIHESAELTTLEAAARDPEYRDPKGEFVIVVRNCPKQPESGLEKAVELASRLVGAGLGAAEAAKLSAAEHGARKNEVYAALMEKREER